MPISLNASKYKRHYLSIKKHQLPNERYSEPFQRTTLDYPIRKNRGSKFSQPVETILANRSTVAIDTQSEMGICS